jgi:carboxymethylenebutenolidase
VDQTNLIKTRETFSCSDGFTMPVSVSRPAKGKLPGLLFVYEVFGPTDEMQRVADDFADAGYVVVMPDLFSRGSWFSCVRKFMNDIKTGQGRSVEDLLDARQWLSTREFADSNRIAVIGFCMGGGFALILAKTGLFRVSAPFYGKAPDRLDGACPIVASYGARDKPTAPEIEKIRSEVQRLQIPNDLKLYPNAGHNFMNRAPNALLGFVSSISPVHGGYDPAVAGDAKDRVLAFLKAHI